MDLRMRQDRIEIALGQVRARVADLARAPSVLERPLHLAGRTHVHPHALGGTRITQRADEPQELGLMLRLEGEPDPSVQPRPVERRAERADLLLYAHKIVRVERGAVLARDRLGVTTGDGQTTAPDFKSGAGPPQMSVTRRLRHGGSGYREAVVGLDGARGGVGGNDRPRAEEIT